MSDTPPPSGRGKRGERAANPDRPKREREAGGGGGGAAARREKRGAGGTGGAEASTRTVAFATADEAQKVLKRAVSGFAKAGAPLDVRMEGSSLTLRLPPKDQQSDEYRKLLRRLRPKGERGGGGMKGDKAAEPSAPGGEDAPE